MNDSESKQMINYGFTDSGTDCFRGCAEKNYFQFRRRDTFLHHFYFHQYFLRRKFDSTLHKLGA